MVDKEKSKVFKIANIVALTIAILISLKQFSIHFLVVPSFMKMFEEMDLELPVITLLLINSNQIITIIPIILFISLIIKEFLIKDKLICLLINSGYLIFSAFYFSFIVTALFWPMVTIMNSI